MAGYPHNPPNYGYGPPPSQPYSAAPGQQPYAAAPGQQPYDAVPYGGGAPSAPYGAQSEKPHKEKPYGAAPPSSAAPYAAGGYPPQAAPAPYGIPFASLVPSAFPPGTDPSVVSCFQMADQDGSGLIDDKELQRALSSYNQSFSLRTVHLLMYLFTNTNTRKIGERSLSLSLLKFWLECV